MARNTTKSLLNDDCLQLKIYSLNHKDLSLILVGFTYVDLMSELIKMIKKWISNIHPQGVQSWHTQNSENIQILEFSK